MSVHVLSLGAGVQSSTLALMASRGWTSVVPELAVFADTQAEPKEVYEWLDWLETQLSFPVVRVTKGSLYKHATTLKYSKGGKYYAQAAVPARIADDEGNVGLMMRQCTYLYKIVPIEKVLKKMLKKHGHVIQWIGISMDEAHRMKPSKITQVQNVWPLVENQISRADCLKWMAEHFPGRTPPRSACSFCPFHNDPEWAMLKKNHPEAFAEAVQFEKDYQKVYHGIPTVRGTPWLHKSLQPLDTVEFTVPSKDELNPVFGNECEGMCGV